MALKPKPEAWLLIREERWEQRDNQEGTAGNRKWEAYPEHQSIHEAVDACSLEFRPATVLHQLSVRAYKGSGRERKVK